MCIKKHAVLFTVFSWVLGVVNADSVAAFTDSNDMLIKPAAVHTEASTPSTETAQQLIEKIEQARRYSAQGQLSIALTMYAEVWKQGKKLNDPKWVYRINRAAGEYLQLMSGVGRVEAMQVILAEYSQGRSTHGIGEVLGEIKRSVWIMQHDPGTSFKCGVYALAKVGRALGAITEENDMTAAHPSPSEGFSLANLQTIAHEWGMPSISLVRRTNVAAKLIYPSIAHLHAGHFVALLGEENGKIIVSDSTLAFGEPQIKLPRENFEQELDGYFAVVGEIPNGYELLSAHEAAHIRGTGYTNKQPESNEDQSPQTGNCSTDACGHISVSLATAQARFFDPLLRWDNPYGTAIEVVVGDTFSPPVFGQDEELEQPIGAGNWGTNWNRFVGRDTSKSGMPLTVFASNYRWRLDENISSTDAQGCTVYPIRSNNTITAAACAATDTWEIRYPTGAKELYTKVAWVNFVAEDYWQLTAIVSPNGLQQKIERNYAGYATLVTAIVDEIGQKAVTFTYDTKDKDGNLLEQPVLTKICDKVLRCAQIRYNTLNSKAAIYQTEDREGVISTYGYATSGDLVGQMNRVITPHGQVVLNKIDLTTDGNKLTQLDYFNAGGLFLASERIIYLADVAGGNAFIQATESLAQTPQAPAGALNLGFLNFRNTLHIEAHNVLSAFDKDGDGKFEANEGDSNGNGRADWNESSAIDQRQVQYAVILHFAHRGTSGEDQQTRSTQVESIQQPAPEYVSSADKDGGVRVWLTRADTNATYEADNPQITGIYQVGEDGTTRATIQTYNAQGFPLTQIDADGYIKEWSYLSDGIRVLNIKIGGSVVRSFTYNDADYPMLADSSTDARGNKTIVNYDKYGRVQNYTDAYGHATRYSYDSNHGRLKQITYPQLLPGSASIYIYQALNYDSYHRLTGLTSNMLTQPWIKISYWGNGDQVAKLAWYNRKYAKLDYVKTFDWRTSEGATTLDVKEECVQKDDGDGIAETGEESSCIRYGHDGFRHVGSSQDALGAKTTLKWLSPRHIASITYPDGTVQSYQYNARGLPTAISYTNSAYPDQYTYDRQGKLIQQQYQNGKYVNYNYTLAGLLEHIDYSDIADVTYAWDSIYPRLIAVEDALGNVRFDYDSIDPFLPLYETRELNTGSTPIVRHRNYDKLGRQNQLQLDGDYTGSGASTTHTLFQVSDTDIDNLNRATRWQTAPGWAWQEYQGLDTSRVSTRWLSTNDNRNTAPVYTNYGYDGWGRMTGMSTSLPEGQGALSINHTWSQFNAFASPQQLTRRLAVGGSTRTLQYDIDAVNQITRNTDITGDLMVLQESRKTNTGKHVTNESISTTNKTFTVSNYGQLTQVSVQPFKGASQLYPYTYDASGNVTNDGRYTYTWGANQLMLSKTDLSTKITTNYAYDYANRLTRINDSQHDEWLEWENDHVVQVRQGNNPSRVYATYSRAGVVDHLNNASYYRINDRNGSPIAFVDTQTQTSVATLDYTLSGAQTLMQGALPLALKRLGFQGMYVDGNSNQLITPLRQYDPWSQRWLSRDPNGALADGALYAGNTYHGFGNNGINYQDQQGGFIAPLMVGGALLGGLGNLGYQLYIHDNNFDCVNGWQALGSAMVGAGLGGLTAAAISTSSSYIVANALRAEAIAAAHAAAAIASKETAAAANRIKTFSHFLQNNATSFYAQATRLDRLEKEGEILTPVQEAFVAFYRSLH